jgi:RHS repeat-associated protein
MAHIMLGIRKGKSGIHMINEYYPFGLVNQQTSSSQFGSKEQRYKYNGKELFKDFKLEAEDYGARMYSPQIGRWSVIDPMAGLYTSTSSYAYVRNNTMKRIDPNGMWDVEVHVFSDRSKFGYGIAVVKDRHGKEVYRMRIRAEGTAGRNRMLTNADTPLGRYDIPDNEPWKSGGSVKSYGPDYRLNLVGISGEIIESGREDIRVHGGKLKDGKLNWTYGCMRSTNEDVAEMKSITDELYQI